MTLLLFIHNSFQLEVAGMLHFYIAILCAHNILLLPDFIFMYYIDGVEENDIRKKIYIILFGI